MKFLAHFDVFSTKPEGLALRHLQEQAVWPPQSIHTGLQAHPEAVRDLPKKVVLRLVPLVAETRNQMESAGIHPFTELVCKYDPGPPATSQLGIVRACQPGEKKKKKSSPAQYARLS